jgi:hypothetical protein
MNTGERFLGLLTSPVLITRLSVCSVCMNQVKETKGVRYMFQCVTLFKEEEEGNVTFNIHKSDYCLQDLAVFPL